MAHACGVASALTGASIEPKTGNYVMGPEQVGALTFCRSLSTAPTMSDLKESELVSERVTIARYRELLGDEARDLSDEDIEAIRRHAQTMAHALIDAFRESAFALRATADSYSAQAEADDVAIATSTLKTPDEGTTLRSMVGAAIYIRVSTKEQTENLSLPTQLRACEEYCRRQGLEVLANDTCDHFALRSLLQSPGISLRSATEPIDDTSTGKLMEGVLAAFAQFDNDVRSDRTGASMNAALEIG